MPTNHAIKTDAKYPLLMIRFSYTIKKCSIQLNAYKEIASTLRVHTTLFEFKWREERVKSPFLTFNEIPMYSILSNRIEREELIYAQTGSCWKTKLSTLFTFNFYVA